MVVRAKNTRWQELEKDDIPLERLPRHFEAYNRSEEKSPRTIEWYGQVLRFFKEYLKEQSHTTRLGDLTLDVAREFIPYLHTRRKWNKHPYVPSTNSRSNKAVLHTCKSNSRSGTIIRGRSMTLIFTGGGNEALLIGLCTYQEPHDKDEQAKGKNNNERRRV